MLVTWEHASNLINKEIVYFFNEFDLLTEKIQNKRLLEYIKSNFKGYFANDFYSITDGLFEAITGKTTNYAHFEKRLLSITNDNEFIYNDYFNVFLKLKKLNNIDFAKSIVFTESMSKTILNNDVFEGIKEGSISTLNSLKETPKISEKKIILKEIIDNNTVIVVDTVVPEYFVETLNDNAFRLYYIGSSEYYNVNKKMFESHYCSKELNRISNYTIEDYFEQLYSFIEADKTEKMLAKMVADCDKKNIMIALQYDIDEKEIAGLINRQDVACIDYSILPYLIAYFNKNNNYTGSYNKIFKNFNANYCMDLLKSLIDFHPLLEEYNITCTISYIMWSELKLDSKERIDEFFQTLNLYKQYQLHYNGHNHFINEALQLVNSDIKAYFEVKLIEHLINTEKYFLLSAINTKNTYYIEVSKCYCENVINDKSIDNVDITNLPESLITLLINFKNDYDKLINSEWFHQDGQNLSNNTIAPFSLILNNKQENLCKKRISKYRGLRPYISNNMAYFFELDNINVINLFSGQHKNMKLSKADSKAEFFIYNKSLIITSGNEAYVINNECERISLNVRIDSNVYGGIRIHDKYVYYFPSSKHISMTNIDDFISGDAFFKTSSFPLPTDVEISNVIDFLVFKNDLVWANSRYLWHYNIDNKCLNRINLKEEPRKLFISNNCIYLLTKNSIYQVLIDNYILLNWITGIDEWERFTCSGNYIVIARQTNMFIIDLLMGKHKWVDTTILKDNITDMIVSGNKLLVIDDSGHFYESIISKESLEYLSVELKNSINIQGNRSMLSYSYRHLGINNDQYLYVFSA